MTAFLQISVVALGILVLFLAFLVLGALRALGLLSWRVEQIEVTSPRRVGRDGLVVGRKAPDFMLPSAADGEVSLHDFAGRSVLLVFTQSGCGPCHAMMPELNRVQRKGEHQVVVVNNGKPDEARELATEVRAEFPVLVQEHFDLSKRYEVFATPFAFVIDEHGSITSKGLVGSRQHLGFVLSGAARLSSTLRLRPEGSSPKSGNHAKKHDPAEANATCRGGREVRRFSFTKGSVPCLRRSISSRNRRDRMPRRVHGRSRLRQRRIHQRGRRVRRLHDLPVSDQGLAGWCPPLAPIQACL